MATGQQYELPSPPEDIISQVRFSADGTRLLVSSWDRHLYLYDVADPSNATLVQKFDYRAPVMDVCWGEDPNTAYTGGVDHDVRRIDLTTGYQTVLSTHPAGAAKVCYSHEQGILVSMGLGNELHVHHVKENLIPATIPLPVKAFTMTMSKSKLIVAMQERKFQIFDLCSLKLLTSQTQDPRPNTVQIEPFQQRESSLKFQTRAIACMPDDQGYATSSIEGRVAVEWFDASEASQERKYAFKCHRIPSDTESGVDRVFPVHALAFHPTFGTFLSGGGDGNVALWDAAAKRRIRQYQRYGAGVKSVDFSPDGNMFAVAISPEIVVGDLDFADKGPKKVYIRVMAEGETKGKAVGEGKAKSAK